jgi:hypothetical protein
MLIMSLVDTRTHVHAKQQQQQHELRCLLCCSRFLSGSLLPLVTLSANAAASCYLWQSIVSTSTFQLQFLFRCDPSNFFCSTSRQNLFTDIVHYITTLSIIISVSMDSYTAARVHAVLFVIVSNRFRLTSFAGLPLTALSVLVTATAMLLKAVKRCTVLLSFSQIDRNV